MRDTIASVVRLILVLLSLAAMWYGWMHEWRGFWQGFGSGMCLVVMVWLACSRLPMDDKPVGNKLKQDEV